MSSREAKAPETETLEYCYVVTSKQILQCTLKVEKDTVQVRGDVVFRRVTRRDVVELELRPRSHFWDDPVTRYAI